MLQPTSDQIATAIAPLTWDDTYARQIAKELSLSDSEAKRFLFSILVLTLDLTVCWAMAKRTVHGEDINAGAIVYGVRLTLERSENARVEVRLGDYTLDVEEYEAIASALRDESHIAFRYDSFQDTLLPFFDLALTLFSIRVEQVFLVITEAAKIANRLYPSDLDSAHKILALNLSNLLLGHASLNPKRLSSRSTPKEDHHSMLLNLSPLISIIYTNVMQQMNNLYLI